MGTLGSDWVEKLVAGSIEDPAGRVLRLQCDDYEAGGLVIGRARIAYTVEDHSGATRDVEGKIYLPAGLRDDPSQRLPLVIQCGYEASDEHAVPHVSLGRIVATVVDPPPGTLHLGEWALLRGPNMEIVLTHLVRSLPFVDLTRVAFAGGSAGGYAALMAAAATFPACVVAAGVPPVNLAFMGAFARHNAALHPKLQEDGSLSPVGMFADAFRQADDVWKQAYGDDPGSPAWIEHSPIGHLDRITCPAALAVSTTDPLVPIDQFDHALAEPVRATKPGGLELTSDLVAPHLPTAQRRLFDELGARADVHVMPMPDGYEPMTEVDPTLLAGLPPLPLPEVTPVAGQWFVAVIDEGEPEFVISHFKHAYEPDLLSVINRCFEVGLSVDQLTPAKLDQLLDRWRGVEWLSPGHRHLDRPAAEQADVERGLTTYCSTSPAHAEHFGQLYESVADDRRVLPTELVERLVVA